MTSVKVSDVWLVTQWSVMVKRGKMGCYHLETRYLGVVKGADHIPNQGEGVRRLGGQLLVKGGGYTWLYVVIHCKKCDRNHKYFCGPVLK